MNRFFTPGLTLLALVVLGCRDVASDSGSAALQSPSFTVAAAPTTTSHAVSSGATAQVEWFGSVSDGFLFVADSGQAGRKVNPQLFYFIEVIDPCCDIDLGSGPIPESDLSGSGTQKLALNTNTATNPDFFTIGPTGQVTVTWNKTSFATSRFVGNSMVSFGNGTKFQTVGTSEFSTGEALGSVVGLAIPPAGAGQIAQLGRLHSVTIDILH